MRNIVIALSCLFVMACSRDKAIMILEAEGYTDIQITHRGKLRCTDEDDKEKTSFRARKRGKVVEGRVCMQYLLKPYISKTRKENHIIIYEYDD